jgi:hypothetical protein
MTMDEHVIFCPKCLRETAHAKARAGVIMCVICRHERPWNTTGWY